LNPSNLSNLSNLSNPSNPSNLSNPVTLEPFLFVMSQPRP